MEIGKLHNYQICYITPTLYVTCENHDVNTILQNFMWLWPSNFRITVFWRCAGFKAKFISRLRMRRYNSDSLSEKRKMSRTWTFEMKRSDEKCIILQGSASGKTLHFCSHCHLTLVVLGRGSSRKTFTLIKMAPVFHRSCGVKLLLFQAGVGKVNEHGTARWSVHEALHKLRFIVPSLHVGTLRQRSS